MGKWIDRIIATALTALGLYLLFLSAFGSIAGSLCLTFFCCVLLFRAKREKMKKCRMSRFQAKTILEQWAYGPDDDAETRINNLLSGQDCKIIYLPRHPTSTLSMNDVFSAWKKHRSEQKLILAAPCYADGRARTFAATMREPSIKIVDAAKLIPLIRRSDIPAPHTFSLRILAERIGKSLTILSGRRPWYRSLLTGLGMMLLYLLSGSAVYLGLSIASLFLSGIGLRAGRTQ